MITGQISRLVVDTSVAVKWFFDEQDSQAALAILEGGRSGDRALVVPDLIYLEFGSVVRRRVQRAELAPEDGAVVVAAFTRIPFAQVLPTRPLLPAAYRLALEYGCTVYDAVFIAAASQAAADCVTADKRLYNKAGERVPGLLLLE